MVNTVKILLAVSSALSLAGRSETVPATDIAPLPVPDFQWPTETTEFGCFVFFDVNCLLGIDNDPCDGGCVLRLRDGTFVLECTKGPMGQKFLTGLLLSPCLIAIQPVSMAMRSTDGAEHGTSIAGISSSVTASPIRNPLQVYPVESSNELRSAFHFTGRSFRNAAWTNQAFPAQFLPG